MGRPGSIFVSFADNYRAAPARLGQWQALAPKYAKLYTGLQSYARFQKNQEGGGARLLARLAETSASTNNLRAMLKGAELLGFVERGRPDQATFGLLTLPPIDTLSLEVVDELTDLGVPLWHGNSYLMNYTWELFVHWCRAFKRDRGRNYRREKWLADEVRSLRALIAATGLPGKVGKLMELFIANHEVLELHRHKEWRDYGTTLLTFCVLYTQLARRLDTKGVSKRDQDELRMEAGRRINAAKKWGRRSARNQSKRLTTSGA